MDITWYTIMKSSAGKWKFLDEYIENSLISTGRETTRVTIIELIFNKSETLTRNTQKKFPLIIFVDIEFGI